MEAMKMIALIMSIIILAVVVLTLGAMAVYGLVDFLESYVYGLGPGYGSY